MNSISKELKVVIAELLLDIGAVSLRPDDPFVWASGILSPIYCDNRLILSNVKYRLIVEEALAETIQMRWPECEMLMGTATAGISHAAISAHLLGLPMGYVRSTAKGHGKANRVEGNVEPGCAVVVIEDLISTGGSSIEACEALMDIGAKVLGVLSIFTYGMKRARESFDQSGITVISLTDLDTLVSVAAKNGYISEENLEKILRFRESPAGGWNYY